ncbi:hypothetical protein [Vampirovibrio sp.]|uniref:hypothetical protein n=1 Tax=Vampirovibrio sp. TaxID=2717857 RepID=UPI00359417B2
MMSGLQQTLEITLVAVQPIQIHESLYYELSYRVSGDAAVQHMRINPEAFYANPQPGDRVAVNVLMGNIMGATKIG